MQTDWREVTDGRGLWGACGVLAVLHAPSGRVLLVASRNVGHQFHEQRSRLLGRRPHCNPALARDLAADGPGAFKTYLVRTCEDSSLLPLLKQVEVQKAGALAYNARPALPKRPRGGRAARARLPHTRTTTPAATPRPAPATADGDLHPLLRRDPRAAMRRVLERVERPELATAEAPTDPGALLGACLRRREEALDRLMSAVRQARTRE